MNMVYLYIYSDLLVCLLVQIIISPKSSCMIFIRLMYFVLKFYWSPVKWQMYFIISGENSVDCYKIIFYPELGFCTKQCKRLLVLINGYVFWNIFLFQIFILHCVSCFIKLVIFFSIKVNQWWWHKSFLSYIKHT